MNANEEQGHLIDGRREKKRSTAVQAAMSARMVATSRKGSLRPLRSSGGRGNTSLPTNDLKRKPRRRRRGGKGVCSQLFGGIIHEIKMTPYASVC